MRWKALTVFMTDAAQDMPVLDAAIVLAKRLGAHLDAVCLGIDMTHPEVYYTAAPVMSSSGAMERAIRQATDLEAAARTKLQEAGLESAVASAAIPVVSVQTTVAEAARFSDLVLAPLPYAHGHAAASAQVVESVLFGAQVPVLVVPGPLPAAFDRVVIAWNDSPEALDTVRAAMPVLTAAKSVQIVMVDPWQRGFERSDPGGKLQQMLARHGVKADIAVLSKVENSVARTLSAHLGETRSQLLVMGAYGHSRLREAILGGATRDMLEIAGVPVLMSR